MNPELLAALKSHLLGQSIRRWVLAIGSLIALAIPWKFDFGRSDLLIWYVGILVAIQFERTQSRLKAMQLRLAWIHDEINRLRGNEPEDNVLTELTAD